MHNPYQNKTNTHPTRSFSPKLKKIIHIQRHGARTSEHEGMELTNYGKEQLVELGQTIYDKYSSLLSNTTDFFKNLQVFSSNYNRTIQSAQYLLQGLYENIFEKESLESEVQNLQSMIQVYKSEIDHSDLLLNGWRATECFKQKEFIKNQLGHIFIKQLLAFLNPITEKISSILNQPINSFYDGYLIFDDIISKQAENNLSDSQKIILANSTLFNTLHFMNDFSAVYTFYGSPLQLKITTQTLISKIYEILNTSDSPSFTVYSGHDVTLDGIFVALNLTNPHCILQRYFKQTQQSIFFEMPDQYPSSDTCLGSPQFAANIQIELYDDHSISFIYENKTYNIPQISTLQSLNNFILTFYENINSNQNCSKDHHKYLRHMITDM